MIYRVSVGLSFLVISGCSATPEVSAPTPAPVVAPVVVATPKPTFDAELAIQQEEDARKHDAWKAEQKQLDKEQTAQEHETQKGFSIDAVRRQIDDLQSEKEQARTLDERDDFDRQIQDKEREIDRIRAQD